jgi:hypothetical protein
MPKEVLKCHYKLNYKYSALIHKEIKIITCVKGENVFHWAFQKNCGSECDKPIKRKN